MASILGADPVCGACIPLSQRWKLTPVRRKLPPLYTRNPVPAAAPTAFVSKHPLTIIAQFGLSANANVSPADVVTPPLVDVTFLNCILPTPVPSFVTWNPRVNG